MTSSTLTSNPYQRIDALEQQQRQHAKQIEALLGMMTAQSEQIGIQARLMAALLNKLGETSESLPGESPLPAEPKAERKGRH